jgi:hypothetical protein
MDAFTLTKWYLDCVDADGRAAIAYWTALGWRGLSISWHSVALYDPGAAPYERSSPARVPAPDRVGRGILWRTDPLACTLSCEPQIEPFSAHLPDDGRGVVEWRCEASAARTRVEISDHPGVEGCGYAERLLLTVAPWRLPIDEMRWGRWISADACRSIVWIDWRGAEPLTAVFVDGVRQARAMVTADKVTAGDFVLVLSRPRILHARSIGDIVGAVRPLRALLPAPWLAVEDRKCLSEGVLDGANPAAGWAIHEIVRFP